MQEMMHKDETAEFKQMQEKQMLLQEKLTQTTVEAALAKREIEFLQARSRVEASLSSA